MYTGGRRNFVCTSIVDITINRRNLAPPTLTLPDFLVTGRWFFDVMYNFDGLRNWITMCIGYGNSPNSILKQLQIETYCTKVLLLLALTGCWLIYDLCCARYFRFRRVTNGLVVERWLCIPCRHAIEALSKQYFSVLLPSNNKTSMLLYNVTIVFY